jgi:hypothetical protein
MHSSFTDRLEVFFRDRPDMWIRADALMAVGGKCAWRTRVSEVRLRLQAAQLGTVENRVRRIHKPDGKHYSVSEYRYRPVMAPQPSLFT